MSKPEQASRLHSPSQTCLWLQLLQADKNVGEKQELSQAAVWQPVVPGDTWEGVCKQHGHVHVSHAGLGRLNLQTAVGRGATAGGKSECSAPSFSEVVCSVIVSLNMAGKNPSVLHGQLRLPASRDAARAKLPIGFYFQMHFIMDCITSP